MGQFLSNPLNSWMVLFGIVEEVFSFGGRVWRVVSNVVQCIGGCCKSYGTLANEAQEKLSKINNDLKELIDARNNLDRICQHAPNDDSRSVCLDSITTYDGKIRELQRQQRRAQQLYEYYRSRA